MSVVEGIGIHSTRDKYTFGLFHSTPNVVAVNRKQVKVHWGNIDNRLQAVDGLDDVMLFDLNFLFRQMQPPVERQYRWEGLMKLRF